MSTTANGGDDDDRYDPNDEPLDQGVADQEPVGKETSDVDANIDYLMGLARRADAGDLPALTKLRRILDAQPAVWQQLGDVSKRLEGNFIFLLAGRDRLVAESILRQVAKLRASLVGGEPSPLEKLLVDQVVATWLRVQHARLLVTKAPNDESLVMARFSEKRLASAQKQFQQAIRSLEQLRSTRKQSRSASNKTVPPGPEGAVAEAPAEEVSQTSNKPGHAQSPERSSVSPLSGDDPHEEFHWDCKIPLDPVELCPDRSLSEGSSP